MNKLLSILGDFSAKTIRVYGITILMITVIGKIFGEAAKDLSSLFELGATGLTFSTLMQLLISSLIITAISEYFFSKNCTLDKTLCWRISGTLICNLSAIVILIICFKWLPTSGSGMTFAWLGFVIAFSTCTFIAIGISILKMKKDEKMYDSLLKSYKEKKEEMKDNE